MSAESEQTEVILAVTSPFVLSAIIGISAFVFARLYMRFNQLAGQAVPEPFHSFKLVHLTSKRRFLVGYGTYLLLLLMIFGALVEMGPKPFTNSNFLTNNPWVFPFFVALLLAGVIPNVPVLDRAEIGFRRLAQRVVGVPPDHRLVDRKIALAEMSQAKKSNLENDLATRLPLSHIRAAVFEEEYEKLLKCYLILQALDHVADDPKVADLLARRARQNFDEMLREGRRKLAAIEGRIADASYQHPNGRNHIKLEIQDAITRTYALLTYLLSCAIVAETSAKPQPTDQVLQEIGLRMSGYVRRSVADRVIPACVAGVAAVLVASGAINATFGFITPGGFAKVPPPHFWLMFAVTFGTLVAAMIGAYAWRREELIIRSRWFETAQNPYPRVAAISGAVALAVACTVLVVPFVDAGALFMERRDLKEVSNGFPEGVAEYLAFLVPYLSTPVMVLLFFAWLIEIDHRLEFNPESASKFFSSGRIVATAAAAAVFAAVVNVSVQVAMSPVLQSQLVDALNGGDVGHFLSHPATGVVAWFLGSIGAGVYVFFHVFISTGRDVHEPVQLIPPDENLRIGAA
jgi:hypothetical protein